MNAVDESCSCGIEMMKDRYRSTCVCCGNNKICESVCVRCCCLCLVQRRSKNVREDWILDVWLQKIRSRAKSETIGWRTDIRLNDQWARKPVTNAPRMEMKDLDVIVGWLSKDRLDRWSVPNIGCIWNVSLPVFIGLENGRYTRANSRYHCP